MTKNTSALILLLFLAQNSGLLSNQTTVYALTCDYISNICSAFNESKTVSTLLAGSASLAIGIILYKTIFQRQPRSNIIKHEIKKNFPQYQEIPHPKIHKEPYLISASKMVQEIPSETFRFDTTTPFVRLNFYKFNSETNSWVFEEQKPITLHDVNVLLDYRKKAFKYPCTR